MRKEAFALLLLIPTIGVAGCTTSPVSRLNDHSVPISDTCPWTPIKEQPAQYPTLDAEEFRQQLNVIAQCLGVDPSDDSTTITSQLRAANSAPPVLTDKQILYYIGMDTIPRIIYINAAGEYRVDFPLNNPPADLELYHNAATRLATVEEEDLTTATLPTSSGNTLHVTYETNHVAISDDQLRVLAAFSDTFFADNPDSMQENVLTIYFAGQPQGWSTTTDTIIPARTWAVNGGKNGPKEVAILMPQLLELSVMMGIPFDRMLSSVFMNERVDVISEINGQNQTTSTLAGALLFQGSANRWDNYIYGDDFTGVAVQRVLIQLLEEKLR